jgi:hypothetical protein
VNKYYLRLPTADQGLEIPIEMNWDFLGKQDSIEDYESTVIEEIIGTAVDFEVSRFSHAEYSQTDLRTSINYEFNFYSSGSTSVTATTIANTNLWKNSYLDEGFTSSEIYYFSNSFTNSFFKLDFYDTNDVKSQTNYFTVIIPVQQGLTQTASTSSLLSNVSIKKPYFVLDFVGDKEGFFFYWLTDREFLDIDTFYMSGKFFDAKLGVFVKMMIRPQAILPNKFIFDGSKLFFNKVILDYSDKTYKIYDGENPNQRVGTSLNPMRWYEYINPPSQ